MGRVWYEIEILQGASAYQIGFANDAFSAGQPTGTGCGDDSDSVGVDGARNCLWWNGHVATSGSVVQSWTRNVRVGIGFDTATGRIWSRCGTGDVYEHEEVNAQSMMDCTVRIAVTLQRGAVIKLFVRPDEKSLPPPDGFTFCGLRIRGKAFVENQILPASTSSSLSEAVAAQAEDSCMLIRSSIGTMLVAASTHEHEHLYLPLPIPDQEGSDEEDVLTYDCHVEGASSLKLLITESCFGKSGFLRITSGNDRLACAIRGTAYNRCYGLTCDSATSMSLSIVDESLSKAHGLPRGAREDTVELSSSSSINELSDAMFGHAIPLFGNPARLAESFSSESSIALSKDDRHAMCKNHGQMLLPFGDNVDTFMIEYSKLEGMVSFTILARRKGAPSAEEATSIVLNSDANHALACSYSCSKARYVHFDQCRGSLSKDSVMVSIMPSVVAEGLVQPCMRFHWKGVGSGGDADIEDEEFRSWGQYPLASYEFTCLITFHGSVEVNVALAGKAVFDTAPKQMIHLPGPRVAACTQFAWQGHCSTLFSQHSSDV